MMAGPMKDYVLLVEDNPDDVELTRRALGKVDEGLELVVAHDGEEGLDACRGTGRFEQEGSWGPPILILLDLKLPKLNGLELLPCFRSEPQIKDVPIVVVSSSKEDIARLHQSDIEVADFVHKPITTAKLAELVERYR